jgi:GNAT superfamily N-acetyltransferase
MLDPRTDAARIRAFFVAPEYARQGVGAALLQACASAAFMAGFRQLELLATLPGVPFYATFGFSARQEVSETVPGGVVIPFVRMWRPLDAPNL